MQHNKIGLGFWCLTPLSTIFQLYRGGYVSQTWVIFWHITWTRPHYYITIDVKENNFKSRIINNEQNIPQTSFIDLIVYPISQTRY
jgi:hypothetical protein